jgi:hypothetical protein
MKCNVGGPDRILRAILGLALIGFGLATSNFVVAAIGLVPLGTAIFRWCPAYLPLKISTCKPTENA